MHHRYLKKFFSKLQLKQKSCCVTLRYQKVLTCHTQLFPILELSTFTVCERNVCRLTHVVRDHWTCGQHSVPTANVGWGRQCAQRATTPGTTSCRVPCEHQSQWFPEDQQRRVNKESLLVST